MGILKTYLVPHPPMIIPEIGRGSEKSIKETSDAYEKIAFEIAELNPETIVISSPHTILYSDYFYLPIGENGFGSFKNFGANEVSFNEEYDKELVDKIVEISEKLKFPAGRTRENELDHGVLVPLYFIRKKLPKCKMVVVGLSGLPLIDNYRFGMIIKKAVDSLNRRVVFIASGDLSHKLQVNGPYGFIEEGPIYDKKIQEICKTTHFNDLINFDHVLMDRASECGHRSLTIMAGLYDGFDVKSQNYSYQDIGGVGYLVASFEYGQKNKELMLYDKYLKNKREFVKKLLKEEDEYVKLARKTINEYVLTGNKIKIDESISKELVENEAGVFVSIHKFDDLRGCIGTIIPLTYTIAEEIIRNAISACSKDDRFNPVTKEELPYLEINVDVLSKMEDVLSEDELDPKKYGILISDGMKQGVLLPNLDGVDTIDGQISIAMRKAGIKDRDSITIKKFEVIRHR